MSFLNSLKIKLNLARNKINGKKYIYIQQPVKDMKYSEALKELKRKEKFLYETEGKFVGRNKELIEKVVFQCNDNSYSFDYLSKFLNNKKIPKGVKIDFLDKFTQCFDDNEICKIMIMDNEKIDEQYKYIIARNNIERLPENVLLEYFDYTNINESYIRNLLKNISVEGKIEVLTQLKNDELKEKLIDEETSNLEFYDAYKIHQNLKIYDYNKMEKFFINSIEKSESKEVYKILNTLEYISPNIACKLDEKVTIKDVDEVANYINTNNVNKGGIIYLSRCFGNEEKNLLISKLDKQCDRNIVDKILS